MNNLKNKFIKWFKKQIGYYAIHDDEIYLWESIKNKAVNSFDYVELNTNELKLLYKIHDEIMGEDWYIVDPLGPKQVHYIMYNNIKNKVI